MCVCLLSCSEDGSVVIHTLAAGEYIRSLTRAVDRSANSVASVSRRHYVGPEGAVPVSITVRFLWGMQLLWS